MNNTTRGELLLAELEAEEVATRKCIERIPDNLFDWKPHEKSMKLGYLVQLVADIPKWIRVMIEVGEINFATWEQYEQGTFKGIVDHFEANISGAKKALTGITDEQFESSSFVLKSGEQVLVNDPLHKAVTEAINHWIHHRGQLTVYMRLNNISVPSIYGPSADDPTF